MIRIRADLNECMGYGNCVLGADGYLDEQDGVVVVLRDEVSDGDRARIEEAVASCPVMALSLHDE